MLPALASIESLEARLGVSFPDDSIELAQAEAHLEDASTQARSIAGRSWVDADGALLTNVPDAIPTVVLAAAKRAVENPNGIVQKTAGDLSLSFASRSASAIYFTDDERTMILAAAANGRSGLQTVTTTRGGLVDPNVWVPVEGSPNLVPFGEPTL